MKHKTAVVAIGFLVLLIVAGSVETFLFNKYREQYKENIDFKNYAAEFKIITEFLLEKYPDATNKWLGISIGDVNGRGIYDSEINDLIECPTEVQIAFYTICDFGFPSETMIFEAIRVQNGDVYFCIMSERYALVYSKGDAPSWYDAMVEDNNVHSRKIEDHWYYICITEKS